MASNVLNILTIGLTSHDDPIPGKKVIYAHMLPISNLSNFIYNDATNTVF